MAIGAALQAAVGLGLALFVVPLLALIDVRLIPGPVLLASVALAVMMAYRGRAAINRREQSARRA
jgi:predicted membrane chloride channel (bestrophin family)